MAAKELNISRASARLNISQPAVSRQIKDLEEELGVILFERQRDGLTLTAAGHTALAHAREVLRQSVAMEESMTAFRDQAQRVKLTIGFISTALPGFLADGLRRFNQTRKDVCVQLHEMSPKEQEQALRDGAIDLALLGDPCPLLADTYRIEPIRKVSMAVVVPADHGLAKRKSVKLEELKDDPFVSLHEKHFPGRPEMMSNLLDRAGIEVDVVSKAGGLSELLGLVAAGSGVALAPADLIQLPHTGVVFITLRHPTLTLVSSAMWHPDKESPALLELVELLKTSPAAPEA